ncbi:hypothetical protein [Nocardiopsis trehalosi]|jgi:hypothetical protein|uniref:hypothetical protein n=1 Tax=Nocardiopsis trehalosi TaxID=109329 RepID=UPI0008334872|nr:hypothetical protein [Nocardiopsis trehalosi]
MRLYHQTAGTAVLVLAAGCGGPTTGAENAAALAGAACEDRIRQTAQAPFTAGFDAPPEPVVTRAVPWKWEYEVTGQVTWESSSEAGLPPKGSTCVLSTTDRGTTWKFSELVLLE